MKSFYDYLNEYACGGDRSYFTVSIPANEDIKHYQIKMIENNKIDLLLPLSIQRINDEWKLYFDITSKIPLGRVLERKPISQANFLHILRQVIKLARELKDYLLDLSLVVFDTSYIFCDPSEFDLYFIYMPVEICENEQEILKTFLKKLLVEEINLSEDSSGVILKRLLEVLKEDNLSIEKLCNCIEEREPAKKSLITERESNYNGQINEEIMANRNIIEIPGKSYINTSKNVINKPVVVPDKPKLKETGKVRHEKNREILNNNITRGKSFIQDNRSFLIIGIIDFVLLIVFIFLATSKSFGTTNLTGKIAGMVMIFSAVNYFLFIRLTEKERNGMTGKNDEKQGKPAFKHFVNKEMEEDIILSPGLRNNSVAGTSQKVAPGITPAGTGGIGNRVYAKSGQSVQESSDDKQGRITDLSESSRKYEAPVSRDNIKKTVYDKTVVLGKSNTFLLYLQNIACPTDRIRLDKKSILIGRLEGSVDHVIHNNAVGKIHAELIEKDGQYFIIDLNSVNGTYINSEKIVCNKPVQIKSGDKITFANESYTFIRV